MQIDLGVATLLVGVAAAVGAVASLIVQAVLEGRRRADERRFQKSLARDARIREWNVRRIEETRIQLTGMLDGFLYILDREPNRARKKIEETRRNLLANAALVGDIAAIRSSATAVAQIVARIPGSRLQQMVTMTFAWPFTQVHRDALDSARSEVLRALERQEERVLADEPPLLLDPELINEALTGLEEQLSRLVRHRAASENASESVASS